MIVCHRVRTACAYVYDHDDGSLLFVSLFQVSHRPSHIHTQRRDPVALRTRTQHVSGPIYLHIHTMSEWSGGEHTRVDGCSLWIRVQTHTYTHATTGCWMIVKPLAHHLIITVGLCRCILRVFMNSLQRITISHIEHHKLALSLDYTAWRASIYLYSARPLSTVVFPLRLFLVIYQNTDHIHSFFKKL